MNKFQKSKVEVVEVIDESVLNIVCWVVVSKSVVNCIIGHLERGIELSNSASDWAVIFSWIPYLKFKYNVEFWA